MSRFDREYRKKAAKYAAHTSAAKACKKYAIGTQTIRKWMKEFGVEKPIRNLGGIYKTAVAEVRAGASLNSVARKYKLNTSNLKQKVDDYEGYTGVHPCMIALNSARGTA